MNIWALRMDCSKNTKFESNTIYSEHGCCTDNKKNESHKEKIENLIKELSKKTIEYSEAEKKLYSLKVILKEPESKDKDCISTILKWSYVMEKGDIVFITTEKGIFISEITGDFKSILLECETNEKKLLPMRKVKLLKNECIVIKGELERVKHRFYGRRTLEKIASTEHFKILKNYVLSIKNI